jgi:hypothetical protein
MSDEDKEFCKIAVGEAFGLCGDPEDAFENAARLMGMNEEDITDTFPLAEKYKDIVHDGMPDAPSAGASPIEVLDFSRMVRRVVMARAWEMVIVNKEYNLQQAILAAWQESMDFYQAA